MAERNKKKERKKEKIKREFHWGYGKFRKESGQDNIPLLNLGKIKVPSLNCSVYIFLLVKFLSSVKIGG